MIAQSKESFENNWTNFITEQLSNYSSLLRMSSTRKKTLLTINILPLTFIMSFWTNFQLILKVQIIESLLQQKDFKWS